MDAFSRAVSRNYLLEKYEKKISALEKKIATLTDQIEKLKQFVASRGLGEAFVEFVKLLAPKSFKQKLEVKKPDSAEQNRQRKLQKNIRHWIRRGVVMRTIGNILWFIFGGLLVGAHPEYAAICAGIRVDDGVYVLCLQQDRVPLRVSCGFLPCRVAVGIFA